MIKCFVAVFAARRKSSGSQRRGSKQRQYTALERISIFIVRVRQQPFFVPQSYVVDINRGEDEFKEKSKKTYSLGLCAETLLDFGRAIVKVG